MSTIVVNVAVTWTTTNAGGVTKTTLPPAPGSTAARTWASTDKALGDAAEYFRQWVRDQVQGLDSNADANCTITTQTVT